MADKCILGFIFISLLGLINAQFPVDVKAKEELIRYLQKYHYLPPSYQEYSRTPSENEISQAVKDLQFIAGLPEDGNLDNRTSEMLRVRRCGITDDARLKRQETMGLTSLAYARKSLGRKNISYSILRYPPMAIQDTLSTVRAAFDSLAIGTGLRFTGIIDPNKFNQSELQIGFETGFHMDSLPFFPQDLSVGHAFPPSSINRGKIHLKHDEKWTTNQTSESDQVNLYQVILHEIGHALGLDHSNNPSSMMYPWFINKTSYAPSQEDKEALRLLFDSTSEVVQKSTTSGENVSMESSTNISKEGENSCPTSIDAAVVVNDRIFFFKDKMMWIVHKSDEGYNEQQLTVHQFWYGLPENLTRIDAAYRSRITGKTIFFIGRKYYNLTSNRLSSNYPAEGRPITDFSLPHTIEKVDAVFEWGHNRRIYFVYGDMYWRYNEEIGRMDDGYPREMKAWSGVQVPVDAAFTYFDDSLYFTAGSEYWKFNDDEMTVETLYPKPISLLLKCGSSITTAGSTEGITHTSASYNKVYDRVLVLLLFGVFVTHYLC